MRRGPGKEGKKKKRLGRGRRWKEAGLVNGRRGRDDGEGLECGERKGLERELGRRGSGKECGEGKRATGKGAHEGGRRGKKVGELKRPESERGWIGNVARERKRPERESGQRERVAGERKRTEKERGWRGN
jgi:hypothetical protein